MEVETLSVQHFEMIQVIPLPSFRVSAARTLRLWWPSPFFLFFSPASPEEEISGSIRTVSEEARVACSFLPRGKLLRVEEKRVPVEVFPSFSRRPWLKVLPASGGVE